LQIIAFIIVAISGHNEGNNDNELFAQHHQSVFTQDDYVASSESVAAGDGRRDKRQLLGVLLGGLLGYNLGYHGT